MKQRILVLWICFKRGMDIANCQDLVRLFQKNRWKNIRKQFILGLP